MLFRGPVSGSFSDFPVLAAGRPSAEKTVRIDMDGGGRAGAVPKREGDSMIIANIVGGLGNQMFQYACARALATELGFPLKVTIDMFGQYASRRTLELERVFSLKIQVAGPEEMRRMVGLLRAPPAVRRILAGRGFAFLRGRRFIAEPHFHFLGGLPALARAGAYLQGYWQSERYFLRHAPAIRSDFTFARPITGLNSELARAIHGGAGVSVHVRRGDYVSNPKIRSFHGVCSREYYFRAMERMRKVVPKARFFVFSDGPEWVKEILAPRYPDLTVVEHNRGEDSFGDMRMMSLCRHHIIANSSFSWWGAWLNPNPDKIVIAPNRWFADGRDDRDIVPATWERI